MSVLFSPRKNLLSFLVEGEAVLSASFAVSSAMVGIGAACDQMKSGKIKAGQTNGRVGAMMHFHRGHP